MFLLALERRELTNAFPRVPSDQLQPGDLVFYRGLGHMGIYIGGGQYVHAAGARSKHIAPLIDLNTVGYAF